MLNYFIIGGDGKEYGPITEGNIRQWLAEGRLNAQTSVRTDADANWRPLATFAEFADIFQTPPTIAPPPSSESFSNQAGPANMDFVDRDYELDIGGCISRGWDLVKNNFGTLFLCLLIFVAVELALIFLFSLPMIPLQKMVHDSPVIVRVVFNYLASLPLALVNGPMMAGLFLVYMKTLRGQPTNPGEVFLGFQKNYWQLVLGAVVVGAIVGGCYLPFQFVWESKAGPLLEQLRSLSQSGSGNHNATAMQELMPQLMSAFVASLPVLLVCLVPVTFFSVCLQFTVPLIIDKQLSFQTAIKYGFAKVTKHWWHMFGLSVVVGLVIVAGALACFVGMILTVPIGIAAMMIAYDTIFGERQN